MDLKGAFLKGIIVWLLVSLVMISGTFYQTSNLLIFEINFVALFIPVFILSLLHVPRFFLSVLVGLGTYIAFPAYLSIVPYLNPSFPQVFFLPDPRQILNAQVQTLMPKDGTYLATVLFPILLYCFAVYVGLLVGAKLGGKR